MNNYESHLSIEVFDYSKVNRIVVLILPVHSKRSQPKQFSYFLKPEQDEIDAWKEKNFHKILKIKVEEVKRRIVDDMK